MHDEDTVHDVDELIRRSTQVEVPVEVQERLRRRLIELRTRVEERPPARSFLRAPVWHVLAMTAGLLVAVAIGLVLLPRESRASQVFAAAAAQLRNSSSLAYTIVLNDTPYVGVDFSYLAPGYRRLNCSWGIEVRTDGATGKQIVLMHGNRTYLTETGKQVESQENTDDFAAQLRSLPQKADEVLGERRVGPRKLIGYRLSKAPPNGSIPGPKQLDVWIDAGTQEADHVDITVQEQGKPAHVMHIRNIRVGAEVDRSQFDLTPPAGYTAIARPGTAPRTSEPAPSNVPVVRAMIGQIAALTAVVIPMQGSYTQTRSALDAVDSYLKSLGVVPLGPPFGRYQSEQHWDAGYPVPPGTRVKVPYQLASLPAGLTASAVVKGAWSTDSNARWTAFLTSVTEQGYVPTGTPMEIWFGNDAEPATQTTEMRIPVTKGN
jgi:outer membrane lipoprotein-sorting protein